MQSWHPENLIEGNQYDFHYEDGASVSVDRGKFVRLEYRWKRFCVVYQMDGQTEYEEFMRVDMIRNVTEVK